MELLKLTVCFLLVLGVPCAKSHNNKYEKHGKNDRHTPTETLSKVLLQSPITTEPIFGTPFDPLTSNEMRLAALIVRAANNSHQWEFEFIGLQDPDKAVILPYYISGTYPPPGSIPRKAHVVVIDSTTRVPSEIVVNLETLKVESWVVQTGKTAPVFTITDGPNVCNITFADSRVIQRITALGYKASQLYCDQAW